MTPPSGTLPAWDVPVSPPIWAPDSPWEFYFTEAVVERPSVCRSGKLATI